ncbi:MAG: NAD(P)H-binding protein [Halioglobus sp.]
MISALDRSTKLLLVLFCLTMLSACAGQQQRLSSTEIAATSQPATRDTTIALLGGTGMAGSHILQQTLAQGYRLRVLSRSPEKLAYLGQRITVIQGDARDPQAIAQLLQGSDVVISAIGPSKSDGKTTTDLTTKASTNIVAAMQDQGIERYIVVSGAAVALPGDERNLTGWLMRQLVKLRYPSLLSDRQAEYELLQSSNINWIALRCPLIESSAFVSEPIASLTSPGSFKLRAGELAHFIVKQISADNYLRQAPFVFSE